MSGTPAFEENAINATLLNQPDAAKDERSHHDLAYLGGTHHQGTHMGSVEWQRGTSFGTSAAGC